MRKKVLLYFVFFVLAGIFVYFIIHGIIKSCSANELLSIYQNSLDSIVDSDEVSVKSIEYAISVQKNELTNAIIDCVISFFGFISCFFLFVYCNPTLFRRSTWTNLSEEWAKNKQERAAARAAKAEEDKQKRIEERQAELDALNGDKKD